MRKTLSLFLLLFFSMAFAQTENKKEPSTESILPIRNLVSKIERTELGTQIKNAITSEFVVLDCSDKQELENYLKTNTLFLGKKIVSAYTTEKSVAKVMLSYNNPKDTLLIAIVNNGLDDQNNYNVFSYNYYTDK